jgi:hypothetical protein
MQEIEIIEKARKGEIILPEAMTSEEDVYIAKNINIMFCRRWTKEPQARWEQKKAELVAQEEADKKVVHKPITDKEWDAIQ